MPTREELSKALRVYQASEVDDLTVVDEDGEDNFDAFVNAVSVIVSAAREHLAEHPELERLREFKRMVHESLDELGIHKFEGFQCRISERLSQIRRKLRHELPPDDDEPVDEEWLRECGLNVEFYPLVMSETRVMRVKIGGGYSLRRYDRGMTVYEWSLWKDDSDEGIPLWLNPTRRQVRQLIEVFGGET